jgi:hypothetical protein
LRNKPGNLALLLLAACVLGDILVARPHDEGDFLISVGTLGALASRAFLEEAQSIIVTLLGLALTIHVVCRNHGIIDRDSDGWYVLFLLVALTYAFWEKVTKWFSI